jgi:hypothetical protein
MPSGGDENQGIYFMWPNHAHIITQRLCMFIVYSLVWQTYNMLEELELLSQLYLPTCVSGRSPSCTFPIFHFHGVSPHILIEMQARHNMSIRYKETDTPTVQVMQTNHNRDWIILLVKYIHILCCTFNSLIGSTYHWQVKLAWAGCMKAG